MLKRKFIISIIFIVLGLLAVSGKVEAADKQTTTVTINGVTANIEYTVNSNGDIEDLVCKNASDLSGKVVIPATIDEKKVVSLGSDAFRNATNITEIVIPDTLTKIGLRSFSDCTGLTKIDLGKGVTSIQGAAFRNCKGLISITIPKSVKSNETVIAPFENCTNITKVVFEDGITEIPQCICRGLTGITEVTIPDSVTYVDYLAFADCTNLKKINWGKGVTSIAGAAFKNCTGLTSITIPKSVKSNESIIAQFEGCTNITSVTFEDGISIIPQCICSGLTGITEITIPNSVTEIDFNSFAYCTNLKKITILDNVTKISEYAFRNHNEDLTIYCYEGSKIDEYAKKYNIKTVYLTRPVVTQLTASVTYNPTTSTTGKVTATIKTNKAVNKVDGWTLSSDGKTLTKVYSENKTETVNLVDEDGLKKSVEVNISNITAKEDTKLDSSNKETTKNDPTVTPKKTLPQTGTSMIMIVIIGTVALLSVGVYSKSKKYRGIK